MHQQQAWVWQGSVMTSFALSIAYCIIAPSLEQTRISDLWATPIPGSAVLVVSLALATSAMATDGMARVRVVHASPDAPATTVPTPLSARLCRLSFPGNGP